LTLNRPCYKQWAKPLGLPSNLGFQDLYSLDPDFLHYTPKPVYAVLLLFPSRGKLFEARAEEDKLEEFKWKGKNKEDGIWWIKQTVSPRNSTLMEDSFLLLARSRPLSSFLMRVVGVVIYVRANQLLMTSKLIP
jgi:hypothetical protein